MPTSLPPPYPRIPHLFSSPAATRDDLVLSAPERQAFLKRPLRVEEKLDGASVSLWLDETGWPSAATRGGPGAVDRGRQLGPLRAWVARRADEIQAALGDGRVLYGEWLWVAHGVRYDRLPDWFVGLDLWSPTAGFAPVDERDIRLDEAGVVRPPVLHEGRLADELALDSLFGPSAYGAPAHEGLILRSLSREAALPRIAKVVAPGFRRREDKDWHARERNALAAVA